jgi:hypothetical protein
MITRGLSNRDTEKLFLRFLGLKPFQMLFAVMGEAFTPPKNGKISRATRNLIVLGEPMH